MSVSVYLTAVLEPTEDYRRKRKAYMACLRAGVSVPKELDDLFQGASNPSPEGQEMNLSYDCKGVVEGTAEHVDGALIDLSKLPEGTKYIRVRMVGLLRGTWAGDREASRE